MDKYPLTTIVNTVKLLVCTKVYRKGDVFDG
jgi:hypothetical protein